ncbi:MAG: acetate kinase [Candidatus Omnitrophota bacterium]|nr:acetate kinase [Candidatus Omnitrophota bacterium]
MKILVINSGSSSIKYQLFAMPQEKRLAKGMIERIGEKGSVTKNHHQGVEDILKDVDGVDAIGHRVVHGAEEFKQPHLINKDVIRRIKACCEIAPLHNPANLSGIKACLKLLKGVKQVAVFDTAFHQSLPDYAFLYGIPLKYYKNFCIRKYGFHGTSHEYVAQEAARRLNKPLNKLNLITCHLGNGCSITAIKKGKSVDTSMGFTPLEGLLMGTRCGDIDAAVVTFLERRKNISASRIDEILNKESGLKGITGIGNDMRQICQAAEKGNPKAKLAIAMFVYRIKKYIGAYTGILGRVDAIVFTGGIGENQAQIRNQACKDIFSNLKDKPKTLVIHTDEELMIARQTYKVVKGSV